MQTRVQGLVSALLLCLAPLAAAQELSSAAITVLTENARREAGRIIAQDLHGHYDIVRLDVLNVEAMDRRLGRDYGLAKVRLSFSTKRNSSRSPNLSPDAFEPGNCTPARVPSWFYLHCGVPEGHVFAGKMELLLAVTDKPGVWTAVSPNWRTLLAYPLQGYLLLDGVPKEGYVVFPE